MAWLFSGPIRVVCGIIPLMAKKKVLVIDDSAEVREFVGETLRRLGFEVVTAITGKIAVARAKEHEPDLILCDVMLPDMDGFEVCGELRKLDEISGTPIIFVSSVGSEKHMERGLEAGANDYLVKPLNAEDVKALVERYLSE